MTTTLRRRLAALTLAAALACCALAAPAAFADEPADAESGSTADLMSVVATGYCGDSTTDYIELTGTEIGTVKIGKNVKWTIYSNGMCIISGKGGMCDTSKSMYNYATPHAASVSITSVEVEEGVTSVGMDMFWADEAITSIDLASTVKNVGKAALPHNSSCTVTVHSMSLYKTLRYGTSDYIKSAYCLPGGSDSDTNCSKIQFRFLDVLSSSSWYYDSVYAAAQAGYIEGYEDGTFGPKGKLTRAQAATILWRYYTGGTDTASADTTGMSDIKAGGKWYTAAANWAVANDVISGKDGGTRFDPNGKITREQLCTIIANAAHKFKGTAIEGGTGIFGSMPDHELVSSYAVASVSWCLSKGVISGATSGGTTRYILPQGQVSRAEMAAIIMNSVNNGLLK